MSCARADWDLEAETGALYDSNLSNSAAASDEEEDWAWKSEVRVGDGLQLSRDFRLRLAADLRAEVWDEFGGLSRIGGGTSAALRYRFGLGRQAPWLLLEDRFGYDRFQEKRRSNWNDSLDLRGSIALSQRIALEGGYAFDTSAARDDFFDLQGHSGHARVIVDITSSLQIGLGYTYRYGDFISYAVLPRFDIREIASERQLVSTFGTDPRYVAYRLRGRTHLLSAFAGYALSKNLSLQFSYEYATTSEGAFHYASHLVEAKLAFAY
ncbi:MAG: hypothetical protein ACREF8_04060 [Chthoniobacterales bacterium]